MRAKRLTVLVCGSLAYLLTAAAGTAFAGDLRIPLPQRDTSSPTQKLNRDGVAELKRGHLQKAKQLFYRAYLLDPGDPFTLNNLGYMAELDGDADRALRYYDLAEKDHTDALIAESNNAQIKGKPLDAAFQNVESSNREVSKTSEEAIVLLHQGRLFEARNLLRSVLPRHPNDPFLLNNLGYVMESLGDLQGALRYYSAAASVRSSKPVIVTPRLNWRGRPVSKIASANAAAVNEELSRGEGAEAATARLNLRGVVALNDNDPVAARKFFMDAYKQDPQNAFTLNNLGYMAEADGDWETAQSYYEAAESGRDANARVSYSTRQDAEGEKLDRVADDNQGNMQSTLEGMQQARRRANKPIELKRRTPTPGTTEQTTPVPPVGISPPPMPNLPSPGADSNPPNNQK